MHRSSYPERCHSLAISQLVLMHTEKPTATQVSALMAGALGFGAFSHSGYWSNILDIGPQHAGVLLGISNTIATFPGILANISTGYILSRDGRDKGWDTVFGLAISLYVFGLSYYLWRARGEELLR